MHNMDGSCLNISKLTNIHALRFMPAFSPQNFVLEYKILYSSTKFCGKKTIIFFHIRHIRSSELNDQCKQFMKFFPNINKHCKVNTYNANIPNEPRLFLFRNEIFA